MANSKTILLVDDDCDFLESLQLVLINENHNVFSTANGYDALERYSELKPDIVFLDIKMPGIDGYETFLHLKKLDADARVVFTSSYILDDTKYQKVKVQSLAGLVNKPIDLEILRKMIKKHAK